MRRRAVGRLQRTRSLLPALALLWGVSATGWSAQAPAAGQLFCVTNLAGGFAQVKHGGRWFDARPIPRDLDPGDTVRTPPQVWARIRIYPVGRRTTEQVVTLAPESEVTIPDRNNRWELTKGWFHFLKRSSEEASLIQTRSVVGAARLTDFMVQVEASGTTLIYLASGEMQVTNRLRAGDTLVLTNGEASVVSGDGSGWEKLARLETRVRRLVQTFLYYPGILRLEDLGPGALAARDLSDSLGAYAVGDLPAALRLYPTGREPADNAERLYLASLVLAAGDHPQARSLLSALNADEAGYGEHVGLAGAIEQVMAAAEGVEWRRPGLPATLTEWLGESYYQQSRAGDPYRPSSWERVFYAGATTALERALVAAQRATPPRSTFGFGWVRRAELEFGFGRIGRAEEALAHAGGHQEGNAHAVVLQGFLRWARNDHRGALDRFRRAASLDGRLGNAWLGIGLTELRLENAFERFRARPGSEGLRDLEAAAAAEPDRSLLRSYLGKAYYDASGWWRPDPWLRNNAFEQLDLARRLDPNDPTPYLYSALVEHDENRPNAAIRELERSIELNQNRAVFRSGLLLDQDRAVQHANLARLYQDNGMTEVARREASRAVESDYQNASAHRFLANSFDALRDPSRIELRYEAPWFNELLLANLLSPVGGGRLSPYVTQEEYSRLFERSGLGASAQAEWRSDGRVRSAVSAVGTSRNTSFGLDVHYWQDDGDRPNWHDERLEIYAQLKQAVTATDTLYFLGKYQHQESGDTFRTYDHRSREPGLRFQENQQPGLLLAGWNHRWGPGANTLFLGGRLGAEQTLSNPGADQLLLGRDATALRPAFLRMDRRGFDHFTDPALEHAVPPAVGLGADGESLVYSPALLEGIAPFLGSGQVTNAVEAPFDFHTRREFAVYSAELQHIQQVESHTLVLGGRLQAGEFDTAATLEVTRPNYAGGFSTPAAAQHTTVDSERADLYAYDFWNVAPWLTLIGGVSWSQLTYPLNYRHPPVSSGEARQDQFSGKAGFTLSPSPWFRLRGVYAEALGGVTFDESVTLEPLQLAGFNQAYRTVLSESVAGSVDAPQFETWGLSLDGKLSGSTWWGASFSVVDQDVQRGRGAFTGYDSTVFPASPAFFPDGFTELLDYREQRFLMTLNQLLGEQFAVGTIYQVTRSDLHQTWPGVTATVAPAADFGEEASLHQLSFFCNWNSPAGFFARGEANWYQQRLEDDPSRVTPGELPREGDTFWQVDAFVGYRFARRRAELTLGVLNINDADYQLSPLSPYGDIPRERTVLVRCRFTF